MCLSFLRGGGVLLCVALDIYLVCLFCCLSFLYYIDIDLIALLNNIYVLQKKYLHVFTHFPNVSLGTSIQARPTLNIATIC